MRGRKRFPWQMGGVVFLVLVWALGIGLTRVKALGPDPTPVPPPVIGENPVPVVGEGEVKPTGGGVGTEIEGGVPIAPPSYERLTPQKMTEIVWGPEVKVTLRRQNGADPRDVSCGVQAAGMVMDALSGGQGPSSEAMIARLREEGLMYAWGTGVEELAYLMREEGYRGSYAFHDWNLEKLKAQLAEGEPVVVSLGVKKGGQVGHFVTVTGLSKDGQWVKVMDPTYGEQVMRVEEFQQLWGQEGKSGLIVTRAVRWPKGRDPMGAWIGLLGLVAGMSLALKKKEMAGEMSEAMRAWIAGERAWVRSWLDQPARLGTGAGWGQSVWGVRSLREPIYREVEYKEPVYEEVEERVPIYKTVVRQEAVYKTVSERVPVYKEVSERKPVYGWKWETKYRTIQKAEPVYRWRRVQTGWRTEVKYVREVKYRTERKTVWQKATSWAKGIWGWFRKTVWKPVTRWVRKAYTVVKRVVKRVAVYGKRLVKTGVRWVKKVIPKRVRVWARTGWRTVKKKVIARYRTVKKKVLAYWRTVKEKVVASYRVVRRRRVVGYRTVKKPEVVGWRTVPVSAGGGYTPHPKGLGLAASVPPGEQPSEPYTPPPGSPEAALLAGDLIVPGKVARERRGLDLAGYSDPSVLSNATIKDAWYQYGWQDAAVAYQAAFRKMRQQEADFRRRVQEIQASLNLHPEDSRFMQIYHQMVTEWRLTRKSLTTWFNQEIDSLSRQYVFPNATSQEAYRNGIQAYLKWKGGEHPSDGQNSGPSLPVNEKAWYQRGWDDMVTIWHEEMETETPARRGVEAAERALSENPEDLARLKAYVAAYRNWKMQLQRRIESALQAHRTLTASFQKAYEAGMEAALRWLRRGRPYAEFLTGSTGLSAEERAWLQGEDVEGRSVVSMPNGQSLWITTQRIRVRTEDKVPAEGEKNNLIGVLPAGTPVIWLGELKRNQGFVWAKVQIPSGRIGWVAWKEEKTSAPSSLAPVVGKAVGEWRVVQGGGVVVRREPQAEAETLLRLPEGTQVKSTGRVAQRDGLLWLEVQTPYGLGWVPWSTDMRRRSDAFPRRWLVPVGPLAPLTNQLVGHQAEALNYGTGGGWDYTADDKARQSFVFEKLARALGRDKTYPADRIHYNLCGELTLSYLLNASPLAFLYTWWLLLDLPFEGRRKGDPTSANDLAAAFVAYGYGVREVSFEQALARLKGGEPVRIVVGVKLDTSSAYITPQGTVPHWSAAVGTVEGDKAYVFLPHEGRVKVMSLEELAKREWGPGGGERKVKIVVPEKGGEELGEDVKANKDVVQALMDTGQPLVLIYDPYENRYELMTKAYLKHSRDLSVLVASPVTEGGDE